MFLLGFSPQSYWIKILLESLISNINTRKISWAWVHHSPTLASYKQSQNEPVLLQEPSLPWALLALQVTESQHWSRGAAAVTWHCTSSGAWGTMGLLGSKVSLWLTDSFILKIPIIPCTKQPSPPVPPLSIHFLCSECIILMLSASCCKAAVQSCKMRVGSCCTEQLNLVLCGNSSHPKLFLGVQETQSLWPKCGWHRPQTPDFLQGFTSWTPISHPAKPKVCAGGIVCHARGCSRLRKKSGVGRGRSG